MVDVLLVDTEPLVRQLVADMLEDMGLRVIAAAAGAAEAQAVLARRDAAAPFVLVIAIRSTGGRSGRGLDGRAVAAELRCLRRSADDRTGPQSLGVVYIGEYASALGGNAFGPNEQFLREPFGPAALVRAVFGVIGREMPRWLVGRTSARPAMHA